MKLKQIVLIIAILFFADSCNKEEPWFNKTIVEGLVVEEHTGEPIENINVIIRKVNGFDPHLTSVDTIAKFKTDEEGHFFYKFKIEDDANYQIFVEDNNCYNQNLSDYEIIPEKKNEYKFNCSERTYLYFHLINSSPYDENDKIELFYGHGESTYAFETKIGIDVNTFIKLHRTSFKYFNYSYEVTKNNQMIEIIDSIYLYKICSADTITINY